MHNIVTFIICVSFAVLSMADVMKVERRKPWVGVGKTQGAVAPYLLEPDPCGAGGRQTL